MSDSIERFNSSVADLMKSKDATEIAEAFKKRRTETVSAVDVEVAEILKGMSTADIASILIATDPGTVAWFDDNTNNNNDKK